ncbi:MAG: SGNH/GDSL hydrolase family protein, partial [Bacillus mycoides]
TGLLADNASYFSSDYIPVSANLEYIRTVIDQMAFYTADKVYISGKTYTDPANFTTPSNCAYVRICAPLTKLETYQLEKGNISTSYEEYKFEIDSLKVNIPGVRSILYTFKDAWNAWENNEKFPVGFLGDSTTDGVGTTGWTQENGHESQDLSAGGYGSVDYINTKAYPYILEQLIKKSIGKTNARIYNIGYSGTYFDWAKPKIDEIFSGKYADVKMVGITYGINDRTRVKTIAEYEIMMRTNLEYFINYFYNKGIQPFIVTSQATMEPGVGEAFIGSHPLRTSEHINSVANRVKRDIAKKYNLEIIEMTDFGEHVMTYSGYSLKQLILDKLHFGDKGHELEAGFLFSHFNPRTLVVRDNEILSFNSQRIKSNVPDNKITYLDSPFEDGFKVKANYTKSDANDVLLQDFWVINYGKKPLDLKAFLTVSGSQYTKLNDTNIPLTSNGQSIGNLDIGLHHIQAFTGETTNVDFKGFTLS